MINDIHQDYLRIHSAPSFGLLWLMPRLDKFRQGVAGVKNQPDLFIRKHPVLPG